MSSEEVRRLIRPSSQRLTVGLVHRREKYKPLTNRLVSRTTRGFACILLLADSVNRFRHITKHLIRISVFVVLLDLSCRLKKPFFANCLQARKILRTNQHGIGPSLFSTPTGSPL